MHLSHAALNLLPDASLLEKASQGATVLVLIDGSPQSVPRSSNDGLVLLPSMVANWKPSWWTGSVDGNFNQGRKIYSQRATFLESLAPEGWADESWYSMCTGGSDFLTDLLPSPVEVLVRTIVTGCLRLGATNTPTTGMSMLWQVGIQGTTQQTVGKEGGTLIVSGCE
jgi:hypothetical protein